MDARFLRTLSGPAGILGGIALVLLALVVTADVVARGMGFALIGAAEIGGVLLALLVFLPLAYTQHLRGHVAIEVLVSAFPRRLRRWADVASLLICAAFSIVLVAGCGETAWESYAQQEFQVGTMSFPLWPVKAVVALGFLLLSIQLVIQLIGALLVASGRRHDDQDESSLPQTTL